MTPRKKRYDRLKNTWNLARWRERHRERYNRYMRAYMRGYSKRRRMLAASKIV